MEFKQTPKKMVRAAWQFERPPSESEFRKAEVRPVLQAVELFALKLIMLSLRSA